MENSWNGCKQNITLTFASVRLNQWYFSSDWKYPCIHPQIYIPNILEECPGIRETFHLVFPQSQGSGNHSWNWLKYSLYVQNKGCPLCSFTPWVPNCMCSFLSTDPVYRWKQSETTWDGGWFSFPCGQKKLNLWKPVSGVVQRMMYSLRPLNLDVYIPTKCSSIKGRLKSALDFCFSAPLSTPQFTEIQIKETNTWHSPLYKIKVMIHDLMPTLDVVLKVLLE